VLDDEHSTKLRRLAERTHTNPGTIPRAFERAEQGSDEARSGLGTPLEDL
jgi:hypothetical protein